MRDEHKYKKQSNVARFNIFKEIIPCGHFIWNDQNVHGIDAKNIDITDLKACIDYHKEIPIINVDRATKRFENGNTLEFLDEGRLCKIEGKNSVKGVPCALVMNIAKSFGLSLTDMDFVFGGSVLGVLGERKIRSGCYFIVQRYNRILAIRRYSNYTWKENGIGTQFERFMIDGKIESMDDNNRNENLTHLRISDIDCNHNYSILCFAEIDGQILQPSEDYASFSKHDKIPIICELKTQNPKYWGCNLPLQMISNNSNKLIYGEKTKNRRGKWKLLNIHEYDRDDIIGRKETTKVRNTEENILYCLKALKDVSSSLDEYKVHLLQFNCGKLLLEKPTTQEYDDCQLRSDVVDSLIIF